MKTIILLVLLFSQVFSQEQTFIREYTYTASERDSKITSRTYALKYIKALLLGEIATMVSSNSHLVERDKNGEVSKEFISEIDSYTVGKVKTHILDEKWDGKEFWIKVELKADPDEIQKLIENPRKQKQPYYEYNAKPVKQSVYMPTNTQRIDPNMVLTAKIAQVLVSLGNLKIYILQYESMHGKWPESFEDMHLQTEQMNDGQLIKSMELIKEGGVKVFLTQSVGNDLILTQEPRSNMGGLSVRWTCNTNVSPRAFDLMRGMECKQLSHKELMAK